MSSSISDREQWQTILRQQKLTNARRWLKSIAAQDDPSAIIAKDYENFLRALETSLQSAETFDLAFQLIQSIYFTSLDYADWERWLIYLGKALEISQELEREPEQATLLVQMGDIYYRKADLIKAEQHYDFASKKFQQLKNLQGYASILSKLAVLYNQQGNMNQGVALCHEALDIAETLNDGWVAAQAYLNLSLIYFRSRNLAEGLSSAEKAYEFYKKQDNPKFATKALINIVAIWAELGNWQAIDAVSDELLTTFVQSGDIRTLSQLKNNLGAAAFNQENYQAAEAFWQEALRLHSQIQEPAEQAHIFNNLGVVYTKMAEWDTAGEMLQNAVSIHKSLGDTYNWANSLDNLADLYEVQGETAVFHKTLKKAYAGLQSIADTPHARQLMTTIEQRLAAHSST